MQNEYIKYSCQHRIQRVHYSLPFCCVHLLWKREGNIKRAVLVIEILDFIKNLFILFREFSKEREKAQSRGDFQKLRAKQQEPKNIYRFSTFLRHF